MKTKFLFGAMTLLVAGCGVPEETVISAVAKKEALSQVVDRGSTDDVAASDNEPSNIKGDNKKGQKPNPDQANKPDAGKPNNDKPNDDKPNDDKPGNDKPDTDNPPQKEPSLLELVQNFALPAPTDTNDADLSLWATYYYLPQVVSANEGYDMLDSKGAKLGPKLSKRDWCNAAMEGSVRVNSNEKNITYNYASSHAIQQVDCSAYFPHKVGGTRFKVAKGAFGDGVKNYILVPFRTIAVDKTVIPYGTIIFIPAARGTKITLPDGRAVEHDGYFFAGDTGSAIKRTHIDVYIGVAPKNPFPWVKSSSSKTFDALVMDDQTLAQALSSLHTAQ
jgi:3D (Asp-Asp-Asp) domain-containing protein